MLVRAGITGCARGTAWTSIRSTNGKSMLKLLLGISVVMCVCDTYNRYCKPCVLEKPSRTITFKPPARKSARKRAQPDYATLNAGVEADPSRWLRVIQSKPIKDDEFKRMKGSDVGLEWLESDENAMKEPIVIENPEGLGMKMPDANFRVSDVADVVGYETPVEVIGRVTHLTYGEYPYTLCRCSNSVKLPWVDPWEVGRVL